MSKEQDNTLEDGDLDVSAALAVLDPSGGLAKALLTAIQATSASFDLIDSTIQKAMADLTSSKKFLELFEDIASSRRTLLNAVGMSKRDADEFYFGPLGQPEAQAELSKQIAEGGLTQERALHVAKVAISSVYASGVACDGLPLVLRGLTAVSAEMSPQAFAKALGIWYQRVKWSGLAIRDNLDFIETNAGKLGPMPGGPFDYISELMADSAVAMENKSAALEKLRDAIETVFNLHKIAFPRAGGGEEKKSAPGEISIDKIVV